jgi:hypothetical protein
MTKPAQEGVARTQSVAAIGLADPNSTGSPMFDVVQAPVVRWAIADPCVVRTIDSVRTTRATRANGERRARTRRAHTGD